jgi:hypothetical protein
MDNEKRCVVCGAHATGTFGASTLPICDNVVCSQVLTDEANAALSEVSENKKMEYNNVARF